jgi:uncharacterized membrane protein
VDSSAVHAFNARECRRTWRGPLGLYSSKRDTRLIVPKATPQMGFTLNFAHPGCTYALIAITALPLVLVLAQRVFS